MMTPSPQSPNGLSRYFGLVFVCVCLGSVGITETVYGGQAAPVLHPSLMPDLGSDLCAPHIRHEEKRYDIPTFLLYAIAIGESGRYLRGENRSVPWPWTVTAMGKSMYFPGPASAVSYVNGLQADGYTNIDVGCMQVNLRAHSAVFRSIEEAMDPKSNVAYAASFLNELRQRHKAWSKAVGYYHSATPHLNTRYRKKIATLWHDVAHKVSGDRALRRRLFYAAQKHKVPDRAKPVKDLARASTFFQDQVHGTGRLKQDTSHTFTRNMASTKNVGQTRSVEPAQSVEPNRTGQNKKAFSRSVTPSSRFKAPGVSKGMGLRDYLKFSGDQRRRSSRSVANETITIY